MDGAGFCRGLLLHQRSGSVRLAGSARDIAAICIRLSSFLCCGFASHIRGEAVTQLSGLFPRRGLQSHQPRIRGFSLSILSSSLRSLRLSCFLSFPAALRPSYCSARPRSFDFKPPYGSRRPYTLSSLPCLHSCIQLHGAALMHFVRNVRCSRTPAKRNSRCVDFWLKLRVPFEV